MNRQVESAHFINTGFPTESYVYLFEGFPYNYAEWASSGMMHDQGSVYRPVHTGTNKVEPSSPENISFYGFGHVHVEEPEAVEEPEPSIPHFSPGSPEEDTQSHSNASSSQMFWEDNIDPDNMTYEELLDLGEAVGTQSRGLSQDLIASLPTSKYKSGGFFSRKKSRGDPCVICQMEYKRGDRQMTLPCKHVYHSKCAAKWLSINKACPVCYSEVLGTDSRR